MAATQAARKARIAAVWGAELDGLDLELFENQQSLLDNRLVCSICTEVLVEAAETKCGHLFCLVRSRARRSPSLARTCVHGLAASRLGVSARLRPLLTRAPTRSCA